MRLINLRTLGRRSTSVGLFLFLCACHVEQKFELPTLRGYFHAENFSVNEGPDSLTIASHAIIKLDLGVDIKASHIQINPKTNEFVTAEFKGRIGKGKVELTISRELAKTFSADDSQRDANSIRLIGNAQFATKNTQIQAAEIFIKYL